MGRLALLAVAAAIAPPGFRTHVPPNAGVSVAVPIGWQSSRSVVPHSRECGRS